MLRREAAPEGRLREATRNGDAASAIVQVKHFTKSLHSSQLTQPAQVSNFPYMNKCGESVNDLCMLLLIFRGSDIQHVLVWTGAVWDWRDGRSCPFHVCVPGPFQRGRL